MATPQNEVVKQGVIFRVLAAISPVTWNKISFWTKASDVEFDDSDADAAPNSLQARIGNIHAITSDPSADAANVAASAEMVHGLTNDMAVTIATTVWAGPATINGSSYYTYTLNCGKVWTACPTVMLSTTVAGEVLPTQAESTQYNNVAYVVGDTDTNTVTFYATAKPLVNLKLIIKGVTPTQSAS